MIVLEYALPIAAALLLVVFFSGLPNLKHCGLDGALSPETPGKGRAHLINADRRDWLIILVITLSYAVSAFTGLGDSYGPESFVNMGGKTGVIELEGDVPPSGIMLYTGIQTGSFQIEYSEDGVNYSPAASFEQGHAEVLKWHLIVPESQLRPKYVRISCDSGTPYLGELSLLDGDGQLIPISCDIPELCDEQSLTPAASSYMNSTYFDEIYHARTAWEHLNGIEPYEISHPPLGKLIISIGISLFGMNPFGWRFMGTLFGVLMLPLMYLLLKRLFGGRAVPSLATLVFATDFMHFVQTRIATIDTYAVFFILLMYLFMYAYISDESPLALALCGISFGLGAASKWTCIYAGGGLAIIWAAHWIGKFQRNSAHAKAARAQAQERGEEVPEAVSIFPDFLGNSLFCLLFFVLIPCIIYYLSYIPYGQAEGVGIFSREYLQIVLDNQSFMFSYHANIVAEHPYSSRWYQWLLDIRPILYYLEYFDDGTRSSICAFVNPALCWGGFLSLFVLGYTAIFRRDRKAAFILVGYLAQLLPWVFISRLTFEYHYFPSTVFLVLAIAYVFQLMKDTKKNWACYAVPFVAASFLLFIVFYPALTGRPVDNATASSIMGWLPSWPI